jgi:hypothetical protein
MLTRYRAYVSVSVGVNTSPAAKTINSEQEATIGQPKLFLRYKVTTGSLSERTKLAYTYHINEFLAHCRVCRCLRK